MQRLFAWFKPDGYSNNEINELIFEHLDIQRLLHLQGRAQMTEMHRIEGPAEDTQHRSEPVNRP